MHGHTTPTLRVRHFSIKLLGMNGLDHTRYTVAYIDPCWLSCVKCGGDLKYVKKSNAGGHTC